MRAASWLRAAAAIGAVVGLTACGASGDRPGMTIFPDMMEAVPYESYAPSSVTADGMAMLAPPEGTVPVDFYPFPYGASEEEAMRAAEELLNPLDGTQDNMRRGRQVYGKICQTCHGPGGDGDGPIIGAGRFPNPPSFLAEHARSYPDGRIYHLITRGQGIMPSHAVQVLPLDRWKVIMHVRELQAAALAAALEGSQ
jgi:mono/diheme cytochrome c family protein